MSFTNILEDGTVEITHKMSDYVKSLPTMLQWGLWIKLSRPDVIMKHGSNVLFTCVGCGEQFEGAPNAWQSRMRDNEHYKIRIMGMVRQQREEVESIGGIKTIEKRHVPVPVIKRGFGCTACLALYHEEEKKVAGQNQAIERVNLNGAQIIAMAAPVGGVCVHCDFIKPLCKCPKFEAKKHKSMTLRTPALRVLEDPACAYCKDTYHKWDQVNSVYVVCGCYEPKILRDLTSPFIFRL